MRLPPNNIAITVVGLFALLTLAPFVIVLAYVLRALRALFPERREGGFFAGLTEFCSSETGALTLPTGDPVEFDERGSSEKRHEEHRRTD